MAVHLKSVNWKPSAEGIWLIKQWVYIIYLDPAEWLSVCYSAQTMCSLTRCLPSWLLRNTFPLVSPRRRPSRCPTTPPPGAFGVSGSSSGIPGSSGSVSSGGGGGGGGFGAHSTLNKRVGNPVMSSLKTMMKAIYLLPPNCFLC